MDLCDFEAHGAEDLLCNGQAIVEQFESIVKVGLLVVGDVGRDSRLQCVSKAHFERE